MGPFCFRNNPKTVQLQSRSQQKRKITPKFSNKTTAKPLRQATPAETQTGKEQIMPPADMESRDQVYVLSKAGYIDTDLNVAVSHQQTIQRYEKQVYQLLLIVRRCEVSVTVGLSRVYPTAPPMSSPAPCEPEKDQQFQIMDGWMVGLILYQTFPVDR